jgi:predicted Rossmann fold nucleotide-binding protein DprA/Smf involved in DNA uptake
MSPINTWDGWRWRGSPALAREWLESFWARWAAPTGFSAPRSLSWNRIAIHARQPLSAAAQELAQAQAAGIRLLTWDEPEYPQRLREIYDPPPAAVCARKY